MARVNLEFAEGGETVDYVIDPRGFATVRVNGGPGMTIQGAELMREQYGKIVKALDKALLFHYNYNQRTEKG